MARETWLSRIGSNLKVSHFSARSSRTFALPVTFICPLICLVGIAAVEDMISVATGGDIFDLCYVRECNGRLGMEIMILALVLSRSSYDRISQIELRV